VAFPLLKLAEQFDTAKATFLPILKTTRLIAQQQNLSKKDNNMYDGIEISKVDEATLEIKKHKKKSETSEIITRRFSDIKSKPIHWLWPDQIALGKITIIA